VNFAYNQYKKKHFGASEYEKRLEKREVNINGNIGTQEAGRQIINEFL
jgi:hypothetical protein